MTKFDPTKPVQTRDGREARIICTDVERKGDWPIVALIKTSDGERPYLYKEDGCTFEDRRMDPDDLINIPTSDRVREALAYIADFIETLP